MVLEEMVIRPSDSLGALRLFRVVLPPPVCLGDCGYSILISQAFRKVFPLSCRGSIGFRSHAFRRSQLATSRLLHLLKAGRWCWATREVSRYSLHPPPTHTKDYIWLLLFKLSLFWGIGSIPLAVIWNSISPIGVFEESIIVATRIFPLLGLKRS